MKRTVGFHELFPASYVIPTLVPAPPCPVLIGWGERGFTFQRPATLRCPAVDTSRQRMCSYPRLKQPAQPWLMEHGTGMPPGVLGTCEMGRGSCSAIPAASRGWCEPPLLGA